VIGVCPSLNLRHELFHVNVRANIGFPFAGRECLPETIVHVTAVHIDGRYVLSEVESPWWFVVTHSPISFLSLLAKSYFPFMFGF
jgi:hypothetical protein